MEDLLIDILKNEIAKKIGHNVNDREFEACVDYIGDGVYNLKSTDFDTKILMWSDIDKMIDEWIHDELVQCEFCHDYHFPDSDEIKQDNNGRWCCDSFYCREEADFHDPDDIGEYFYRASREDN